MRRTEQEFKAEVLRRSEAFCRERDRKRKKLMGTAICSCLVIAVMWVIAPTVGVSKDAATAGESVMHSTAVNQKDDPAEMIPEEAAPMEDNAVADAAAEIPMAEPAFVKVICGEEEITLDENDSAVILEYLSTDEWAKDDAACLWDYTISVNGLTYRYHSDSGIIRDESGRYLKLAEADKDIFNNIMARCPMRIN